MNKKAIGSKWEAAARDYIKMCGYEILYCNYKCSIGEVDIIAKEEKTIVFIEVKFRSSGSYGTAVEAVDNMKQQKIRHVAAHFLMTTYHTESIPCRFDVLGFDKEKITYIKNAF